MARHRTTAPAALRSLAEAFGRSWRDCPSANICSGLLYLRATQQRGIKLVFLRQLRALAFIWLVSTIPHRDGFRNRRLRGLQNFTCLWRGYGGSVENP